ncbi:MAG: putative repeat protein (TIGR03803 family) [Crocinitomicaceae bacterium]|jgi:uncharacterized repeat protein (TIGR03803 family)
MTFFFKVCRKLPKFMIIIIISRMRKVFTSVVFLLIVQSVFSQELWGLTSKGGQFNMGTIFHTDINGTNLVVEHDFQIFNHGKKPSDAIMCEAPNGKLYGTTPESTMSNGGVLYEYDPLLDTYSVKHFFNNSALGNVPEAGLVLASNGKMYGTTSSGGIYGGGTIYEYDPVTEIYTKKIDFDGPILGENAHSALTLASNGLLYGVTANGGSNAHGILFEYNLVANTCTKRVDFDMATIGGYPKADIVEAGNGKLYLSTVFGAANNHGAIVEYDPITYTATDVFDYDLMVTGGRTICPMMLAGNGNLYGMATEGGVNDMGTLFEFNVSTYAFSKKVDLAGASSGDSPHGGLIEASTGMLYGMTQTGGAGVRGVLFEYQIATDTLIKKYDFYSGNGTFPKSTFMKASNGKLYATTGGSFASGNGAIIEYDYFNDSYSDILEFEDESNGVDPSSGLTQTPDGMLYGLTSSGGAFGRGVLYQFNPATSVYTVKHHFDIGTGYNSRGVLLLAQNGKLYGGARDGGPIGKGMLYEYDPNMEVFTVKYNFNYNGHEGVSDLLEVSPGTLMGITSNGGSQGDGVVYLFNYNTNQYTYRASFHGILDGRYPASIMVNPSNGNYYAFAAGGGPGVQKGTLYEYNPLTNDIDLKVNFEGAGDPNGGSPLGYPALANNGKVYGTNSIGGANGFGCLFEYDALNNTFTPMYDFQDPISGYHTYSLMKASTGKLYGTGWGGTHGFGMIFEYDVVNDTYTKTHDFDSINGDDPFGYPLLEIGSCYPTSGSAVVSECNTYTVPSGNQTFAASGNYTVYDIIPSSCGGDSLLTIDLTITNDVAIDVHFQCDSLQWIDGNTYTSSNTTAVHTILNGGMNGCDSLVYLDLTITSPAVGIDQRTECTSYTWIDGNTYNSNNNTALHTISNGSVNGCDSTVALDLTIVTPQYGTDVITECYSLTWLDGNTYTSNNNTATHTILNGASNGCDSIVTLDLTLMGGPGGTDTQVSCGPFTWINFITYSSNNITASTILPGAAVNGCDSTVTLNLTVLNPVTGIDVQTTCASYTWINGVTYTAFNNTATYTISGGAANGCDSIVTLNLTISPIDATASQLDQLTLEANLTGATYQWLDCLNGYAEVPGATDQIFLATANGEYAVQVTNNGCTDTSSCFVISNVGLLNTDLSNSILLFPVPVKNTLYISIPELTESATYRIIDIFGAVVFKGELTNPENSIDVSTIASGTYFIKFANSEINVQRFVKN